LARLVNDIKEALNAPMIGDKTKKSSARSPIVQKRMIFIQNKEITLKIL